MTDDNVVSLKPPAKDSINKLLKEGAQRMLAQVIEAEVTDFLAQHSDLQVEGKPALVRNGYKPERIIQTGPGDIAQRKDTMEISTLTKLTRKY